jgi:hypothetical protein
MYSQAARSGSLLQQPVLFVLDLDADFTDLLHQISAASGEDDLPGCFQPRLVAGLDNLLQ